MRILYLLVSFALLLGIAGCITPDVNSFAGRAYTGDRYSGDFNSPGFSRY